jgi:hypothetical protein
MKIDLNQKGVEKPASDSKQNSSELPPAGNLSRSVVLWTTMRSEIMVQEWRERARNRYNNPKKMRTVQPQLSKQLEESKRITKERSLQSAKKLITTLGDDACQLSQIKTCLQRFKNGDLSCKDHSRPARPVLTLGSQLEAFLFYQKVANSISYISSTTFFRI